MKYLSELFSFFAIKNFYLYFWEQALEKDSVLLLNLSEITVEKRIKYKKT